MCETFRSLLKELSDRDATWPTARNLRTLVADIHRTLQMCLFYITTCDTPSFQMKPTWCTLRLGIFISTSLHVSGNYVPNHQENLLYLSDTGVFHPVWVAVWSTDQTATAPNV